MQNFIGTIQSKLQSVHGACPDKERAVLRVIWEAWSNRKKVTQRQVAKQCKVALGHHKVHEEGLPVKEESTLRMVRQLVRNLRVDYGVPILSDRKGYWLPYTMEECKDFLATHERTAKAQMAARYEMYRALEKSLGLRSDFFEAQTSLFTEDYGGEGEM